VNKYILILFITLSYIVIAQKGGIKGKVTDEEGKSIIGANILIQKTLLGTATDSEGYYKIENIPEGKYNISVSVIGYSRISSEETITKETLNTVDFKLNPKSYQTDQLVITANKYETDIREIPASSYVLDQNIFSEKNFKQLDNALRYVPGVTMTADQLSIRGSSGYSRGAGTRVLVAIDGIPIYSPDSGDIIWELVPISEIGRVEIIKGSASSIYGSSAIGGVVNIITKKISSNPVTFIKLQGGFYSNPSHKEWEWTDRTLSFNKQTVSHSRTIGNLSLSASLSRQEDYSYRQNDYLLRFAGFIKANYTFSEFTSLSLLGTGFTRDRNIFNYWKNIENALSPPDDNLGEYLNADRSIIGINFNHILNDKISISFSPSIYNSYWIDNSESRNKSNSKIYRGEVRTNYKPLENLKFIAGTEIQLNKISSNIFGDKNMTGFGIFSQADYKPYEKANVSLGLRYDFNKPESLENTQSFSPKLGITYKYSESTFFRGLIARGFRAPTLAEAFTSTSTAGITVKPNPDIKPETSYSFEFGVNHIFSENLSVDLSLFNNEYFDMIEPGFDPSDGLVFFNNVTRARIQGIEFSSFISPISNLNCKIGYTYLWPRDIEEKTTLNYRSKHSILFGFDYKNYIFQLGIDFRFLSMFENIDNELVDLGVVPDGDERVDIYVLDANIGINLFTLNVPLRFYIRGNNLLNYNYVELIGNIAPIRNFSLSAELIF